MGWSDISAEIEFKALDRLGDALATFGAISEDVINDYFREVGADQIATAITRILPVSGRTWSGKHTAAKAAGAGAVFRAEFSNLSIITRSKPNYNYLYFPDDGSRTIHHQGNQQFMQRGGESAAPEVAEGILTRLAQKVFEEV